MSIARARLEPRTALAALMHADALLPQDVMPAAGNASESSASLVTGATGFLGRQVVRELLLGSRNDILCLVRGENPVQARERLAYSLRLAGIDAAAYAPRLQVVIGTVEQSRFGLGEAGYQALAERVGRVFHCAAEVNWARGYRQLRASNVCGTLEVIRFACAGQRKRIFYTSTIAVCFATEQFLEIDERSDMLPQVDRLPLPYAQTKCVSESLLRAAAGRGLPVSVIRPALISGHSETGVANNGDLISALIQGCVASGSAIDTDWLLDCVPVDHVARVLAGLGSSARPHWETLNLFNERARHWREVVLWMNLQGYPVELVAHAEWLRRCFDRPHANYKLFGYRRFFGVSSSRGAGFAPYEAFLAPRQNRVRNDLTQKAVAQLGLEAPALDSTLLESYLEYYRSAGLLPCAKRVRRSRPAAEPTATVRELMGPWLESRNLAIQNVSEVAMPAHNGIFNEVAAARAGSKVGMHRYRLALRDRVHGRAEALDILVKSKPSDTVMQDLMVEVAALCHPELGAQSESFRGDLGLTGCHERELALYETSDPVLRQYMPLTFGTSRNADQDTWSIAMQYLPEAETVDLRTACWTEQQLMAVLHGLAELHASGFRRADELGGMPWLRNLPGAARAEEMSPFWMALAGHSAPYFDQWLDQSLLPLQRSLIASVGSWWAEMQAMPQTLVHNDCNPRNLVIRDRGHTLAPVFFDWELATIDVPQRDVAEILCFMLPKGSGAAEVAGWIEQHRRGLENASGSWIDAGEYLRGFHLALCHLLVHRLPLYTLMHRFRPQPFLPGVIQNWKTLYEFSCGSSRPGVARPGYPETLPSRGIRAAGQGARPARP